VDACGMRDHLLEPGPGSMCFRATTTGDLRHVHSLMGQGDRDQDPRLPIQPDTAASAGMAGFRQAAFGCRAQDYRRSVVESTTAASARHCEPDRLTNGATHRVSFVLPA
jgi:hypothetical protein